MNRTMQTHIYRSKKKEETYVFLARENGFDVLPPAIEARLGPWVHVMTIDITPGRKLARGNADEVRAHLTERGFYLQFPPASTIDPMTSDWGTDA